ncbi:50S ribosomal protein L24 [Pontivivens insulae]|uniref:Large ribosomal subunit protein uL24 n=1 Tax=Pontivivens insulae TaxID=1639689 RepID=A0A2R8A684_9RHOB|nr:50S ribosomal protein L24 [Pontivivens insulae]RED17867.1 LSU ribosomal protein L24P [Pontivivens insulae]SPF27757.1 50S ribosomal protein L24 [Pontivivens insulae]
MAAKLRKGDKVVVLAGKDKGREGEITAVMPKEGKAVVSGINVAIRHTKQSQTSQGGRISKEMPIQLSNLALVDPKEGGATRVGFRMEDGKKVRFAKKSGETINA